MYKHYKKLILFLIPLFVGSCLTLALGSAEQPAELSQEELNKVLVRQALNALSARELDLSNDYFDPDYIHHLPNPLGTVSIALTLEETRTWFFRFDEPPSDICHYIYIDDIITEGNKAVVRFQRMNLSYPYSPSPYPVSVYFLSSEIWIWRIADGKIVESWSVSDDAPHVDYDVTNESRTTLKAVYFLNPNPADNDLVSPGEVELSWTLPDPYMPGQLVPVDVYFTDDLQLLQQFTDLAAIQVVSKQNVTSVIVQTQLKTWYYWAVDAYVGSAEDPVSGPIFSFFADNIPPTVNGQKYQLGGCSGTVIGACSDYDASCDDLPNGEDDCNNEVIGCYWVGCTGTTSCDNFDGDSWFCNYVGCSWEGCDGSATNCDVFGSWESCTARDGCEWIESGYGDYCSGTTYPCDVYDDSEIMCRRKGGCSWLACEGTDVSCNVFDCQDDCEYFGCSWLACQGTPTPCRDLSAETCESQFGCYWKDAGKDIVTWLEDGFRTVNLDATITDDGLLYPYTVQWTVIKEPNEGTAVIETATAEDTSVTLSAVGKYVLQLEAFDGEYTGSDTVTINVYNLSDYIHFVEDINGGRKVNWNDLELMLENWLQDNSLTEE